MTHWIVKQTDRVPRYLVVASSFTMDSSGNVTFCGVDGANEAAIADVEYIKPNDKDYTNEVTIDEEED